MCKLYPHNQFSYDKLKTSLETNDRACIVQPTGTGKSFITAEFLKENPNKNFLLLTSNSYIVNQFDNIFKSSYNNYIYKTYPSLLSSTFNELLKEDVNYIFLDEFHRVGAELWGEKVKLLLNHFPNAKVVGLTATHIRYMDEDNDLVEEYFDGNLVHHLTLMECFDTGILPRPKYISTIYNIDNEYNSLIDKINKSKSSNKSELKKRIIEYKAKWEFSNGADIVLKKHINKERNFLIFCRDINHLEEMILTVKNWFKIFKKPINIFKVYSEYNNSEKELKEYHLSSKRNNEEFNLLFSVQQLNEGLHAPNVNGIIFLRPTESHIIYYQQLGRGLSSKGNQPIVFDMVNNFKKPTVHTDFSKNSYEPIFRNDYLKTEYDDFIFSFNVIDEVQKIKVLFKKTEKLLDDWIINFNLFKASLEKHQKYSLIPYNQKKWFSDQKKSYRDSNEKESSLWKHRIKLFQSVSGYISFYSFKNIMDEWSINFEAFKNAFEKYKKYELIPSKNKKWFTQQRKIYIKTNNPVLWNERILLFDSIKLKDFFLQKTITKPLQIKTSIEKSSSFIKVYNSIVLALVNNEKLTSEQKKWIINKRTSFFKNKLSLNKISKMNNLNKLLGYDWKEIQNNTFNIKYEKLKEDLELNKHKEPYVLSKEQSAWIREQRRYVNKSNNLIEIKRRTLLLNKLIYLLGKDWQLIKSKSNKPMAKKGEK